MVKIYFLLTFDHELPLGGIEVSYDKALFKPTDYLLKLSDSLNVPITLFTDILSAEQFRIWNVPAFYQSYDKQLINALKMGHDVQLHIHPHWLTTTYSDGTFIPSDDYKLADFRDRDYPNDIRGIIEKAVAVLYKICRSGKSDYQCVAFRGGGYNLEPATREILSALHDSGIRIDSSISKGYFFSSALSTIDYFNVPSSPNWFISAENGFRKESSEGIFEIPIASRKKNIFEIPTSFKMNRYHHRAPEQAGKQIHHGKPAGYIHKVKQLLSSRLLSFDNYTYSVDYLLDILQNNVKEYRDCNSIYICGIGHPKSMSEYSFELYSAFVQNARKIYGNQIEFVTYSAVVNKI
jgi:hypothetical protein